MGTILFLHGLFYWLLSLQSVVSPCKCGQARVRHQGVKIKHVSTSHIPSCINESSGLVLQGDTLVSMNDSGGLPYLYRFWKDGTLIDSVLVSDAKNTDWEELASTTAGQIIVGDIGNNLNNRHDLGFYFVNGSHPTPMRAFYYQDQTAFPPPKGLSSSFDCEAFIATPDSLILFTKCKKTRNQSVYSLNIQSDTGVATPLCKLGINAWVTGAAWLDDGRFVLLAYGKILICRFVTIEGNTRVSVEATKLIPLARQTEAVAYDPRSSSLFITNEQGQLFEFKITRK